MCHRPLSYVREKVVGAGVCVDAALLSADVGVEIVEIVETADDTEETADNTEEATLLLLTATGAGAVTVCTTVTVLADSADAEA